MKNHNRILFFCVFLVLGFKEGGAQQQCTNFGKEFWLCFMDNATAAGGTFPRQWIYITSMAPCSVRVDMFGLPPTVVAVNPGAVSTVSVPLTQTLRPSDHGISIPKGIHVYSLDGTYLTVYALNREQYSTDATTCIPIDGLGKRYRAVAYPNSLNTYAEVATIATEDSTTIVYTYSNGITLTNIVNKGNVLFTFGAAALGDIDGCLVTADKPVAVFSGHNCTNVPVNQKACDHLYEQLLPVPSWGQVYHVTPFRDRLRYRVRVHSDYPNTEVRMNNVVVGTLNVGQLLELERNDNCEVWGSNPIQVMQFMLGTVNDGAEGDPSLIMIPPIQLYLNGFTFLAPTGVDSMVRNYINIIVPTVHTDKVQLDGVTIDKTLFSAIPKFYATRSSSVVRIKISSGQHTVRWNPNNPPPAEDIYTMGATQYGMAKDDSYAYAPGFGTRFEPLLSIMDTLLFSTLACKSSVDSFLLISNVCFGPMRIDSIVLSGTNKDNFLVNKNSVICPYSLYGNSSVKQLIRFVPTSPGTKNATLKIYSNLKTVDSIRSVALRGTKDAVGIVPLASGVIDLGSFGVGTSKSATAKFKNIGTTSATVNGAFFKDPSITGNFTTTFPFTVNPSDSFAVNFTVKPTAVKTYSTQVCAVISSPCPDTAYSDLVFRGTSSGGIFLGGVDYGTKYTCNTKLDSILVQSFSSVNGQITNVTISGDVDFQLMLPTLPIVLPAGGKVYIHAEFRPAISGSVATQAKSAVVKIIYKIGSTTDSLLSSLSGLAAQQLASSTKNLDFGYQEIGTTSSAHNLTIYNNSVGKVKITGINAQAPFETVPSPYSPLPEYIAANDSLIIPVVFKPGTEGKFTTPATVTIDSSCNSFFTSTLSGEGTKALRELCFTPRIATLSGEAPKPGEKITMLLELSHDLSSVENVVDVTISYDASMLRIDPSSLRLQPALCASVQVIASNVSAGTITVRLSGCTDTLKAGTVISMNGEILLSPHVSSTIEIASIDVPSTQYKYILSDSGCSSLLVADSSCIAPGTLRERSVATLGKNIPNPFSESTTISVHVKGNVLISLGVFDVFGEEIARLCSSEELSTGEKVFVLNSSHLPSGVYYCRLISNRGVQVLPIVHLGK